MTPDQQLFEKVRRDGECWHIPDNLCVCSKCGLQFLLSNPDFTTWGGFGWLWERVNEKEWWYGDFGFEERYYITRLSLNVIRMSLIHPTKFRDSLMEFLGIEEA